MIRTSELLHSLRPHSQDHPSDSTRPALSPGPAPEQIRPLGRVLPLIFDRELDLLALRDDVRIIYIRTFQISQNLLGLVDLALCHEPARRVRQPRYGAIQDDDEDELECERKSPGYGSADKGEAVRDPVGEGEAGDVHDHFDDDEFAAPGGFGGLALPDGSRGGVETVAYSCDDSAATCQRNEHHLGVVWVSYRPTII